MIAQNSEFAVYSGWQENHYFVQSTSGKDGVVTFSCGHAAEPGRVVGAFHSVHGDRWHGGECEWDLKRLFRGCSDVQMSLARQAALPHLALEHMGRQMHRVTAAFWDKNEYVTAPDPWDELLANGVNAIEVELIEDLDAALRAWQENYEMSEEQVAFSRSLFERKVAKPGALLELSPAEARFLASTFQDPRLQYEEMRRLWEPSQGCGESGETRGTMHVWWDTLDPKVEAEKATRLCREAFAAMGIMVTCEGDSVRVPTT
jgi:hypothetical protein